MIHCSFILILAWFSSSYSDSLFLHFNPRLVLSSYSLNISVAGSLLPLLSHVASKGTAAHPQLGVVVVKSLCLVSVIEATSGLTSTLSVVIEIC